MMLYSTAAANLSLDTFVARHI